MLESLSAGTVTFFAGAQGPAGSGHVSGSLRARVQGPAGLDALFEGVVATEVDAAGVHDHELHAVPVGVVEAAVAGHAVPEGGLRRRLGGAARLSRARASQVQRLVVHGLGTNADTLLPIQPNTDLFYLSGIEQEQLLGSLSLGEIAFAALLGRTPGEDDLFAFQTLVGLLLTNGPGAISAQGAKGAVSADGPEQPERVQLNKGLIGFLTHCGYAHGGNGYEGVAFLLEQFRGYPVAVELRHRSWSDRPEDTLALLSAFGAAWTQIDEPKFRFSIRQDLMPHRQRS